MNLHAVVTAEAHTTRSRRAVGVGGDGVCVGARPDAAEPCRVVLTGEQDGWRGRDVGELGSFDGDG